MSIREYKTVSVPNFDGPWTRLEPSDVPPNGSLLALNTEFNPGQVATRKGFTSVWNPAETVASMHNWVFADKNYLVYFSSTSGKVRLVPNLTAPSPSDLYTPASSAAAHIAASGPRIYISTFDSNINGTDHCRVTGQYGAAIYTDKAFMAPLAMKPTLSSTGTGRVTAGVHRVGYMLQTRSGFQGRLSPVSATTGLFDVTSTVTSAASQTISFSINAAWPTEAAYIYPILCPVSNPSRYFIVPGVAAGVPGGSTFTINMTIDISDDELLAGATEVTDHLNLWTQSAAGAAPFNPFAAGEYGFRTYYMANIADVASATLSQLIVSEPERPQHITADQHVLSLPGFRQMRAAFPLGGMLYVLGPHWTYAFRDSGGVPVTWPTPDLIDSQIGALAPRCVATSASQGFAWVAHPDGLYLFAGGQYGTRPVSYYVDPDWKTINWAYAHLVQVVDDKDKQRVAVLAPLGSATAPTHLLVFDYSNGLSPEKVRYSKWNIGGYTNVHSAAIVQNATTKNLELWLGTASKVLRQKASTETTPYNDDSNGIDWQFETAPQPRIDGTVYYHYGNQFRAIGSGTLSGTTYGIDRTVNTAWSSTLAAAPGTMITKLHPRIRSEAASMRFTNGATANAYCLLSMFEHLYSDGPAFR